MLTPCFVSRSESMLPIGSCSARPKLGVLWSHHSLAIPVSTTWQRPGYDQAYITTTPARLHRRTNAYTVHTSEELVSRSTRSGLVTGFSSLLSSRVHASISHASNRHPSYPELNHSLPPTFGDDWILARFVAEHNCPARFRLTRFGSLSEWRLTKPSFLWGRWDTRGFGDVQSRVLAVEESPQICPYGLLSTAWYALVGTAWLGSRARPRTPS